MKVSPIFHALDLWKTIFRFILKVFISIFYLRIFNLEINLISVFSR